MSYQYKVIKECYFGGVHRTPENRKHNIVVVDDKFPAKKKPSYLELIVSAADAEEAEAIKIAEEQAEIKKAEDAKAKAEADAKASQQQS
jgi:hypothetical protein